jgi:hypothetical protein
MLQKVLAWSALALALLFVVLSFTVMFAAESLGASALTVVAPIAIGALDVSIMLAVAMLTSAVLVFFMDGSLLWPLSTLFANPLVYPLASVVYPAFLVQTLVVSMFCQSLGSAGADSFVWSGGMSNYSLLYVQLLFVNFLMALALALVVERPLYRMTRDRYRAALL